MTDKKKKGRRVARLIDGVFRTPKTNVTIQRHPERYYKHVWIDQPYYEAVEFMARANGTTKKRVLDDMLELGIGEYFAARIAEQNELSRRQSENGQPRRPTYFVIKLRQWAREKGYEISKFV